MSRIANAVITIATAASLAAGQPVAALGATQSEVVGLQGEEMLKLRAGPGTGYRIIVGLPNGTLLRTHSCDRVGGTNWCKVSLKEARSLKGYVSGHYLRQQ